MKRARIHRIVAFVLLLGGLASLPILLASTVFSWSPATVFTAILAVGISLVFICLKLLGNNRFVLTRRALEVTTLEGTQSVFFSSIIRIERVRHRVRGAVQEWARIIYRQGERERHVDIRPENATLFVFDLVSRCPQLTGFDQRKMPHVDSVESDSDRRALPLVCA